MEKKGELRKNDSENISWAGKSFKGPRLLKDAPGASELPSFILVLFLAHLAPPSLGSEGPQGGLACPF